MNEFETAVVNEPSVFGLYLFISERGGGGGGGGGGGRGREITV